MAPLRSLVVILCIVVLAVAAAGCGGGTSYSGTSPDTWAAGVCGALRDWARGLQADSRRLRERFGNTRSLPTVKRTFVAILARAETSAGMMITKVHAVGSPAVKDGPAFQRELEGSLRRFRASLTSAGARARKLPATDPQAFGTGLTALFVDVQARLNAIGEDLDKLEEKYDEKKLNDALSSEPACSSLGA